MKVDQLLEQLYQKNMANLDGKCVEQNENVCSDGKEKSIIVSNSSISEASMDDKNKFDLANPLQQGIEGSVGNGNHANLNEPNQHLNFISAFLKANPLPNFSIPPSCSITTKKPLASKSDAGNSPVNLSPTATNSFQSSSSSAIIPFSQDLISQGLLAVGGCRQCSKTFTDHLSLIHHFVDHFPNIFYCFDDRISPQQRKISPAPKTKSAMPIESKIGPPGNGGPSDFLGQLAGFMALVNGAYSNGSPSSSLPMPISSAQFQIPLNSIPAAMPFKANANPILNQNNKSSHHPQTNGGHVNGDKKNVQSKMTTAKKRHQQMEARESNQNVKKSNGNGLTAAGNENKIKMMMPALSDLPYHMCPHCCLTFAETTAFKSHLAMHESDLSANSDDLNGLPTMVSLFGQISSSSSSSIPTHQPQQLVMKCPLCEMKFSNAFRLNEHMRFHSAHSCEICQKTFMTAFDLNLHMGTHTGYTYDCKDCGKCFPCRKSLAEHNRSHRMILSGGGNPSPEPIMAPILDGMGKAILENVPAQMKVIFPFTEAFDQQQIITDQNIRDRRKMRAPRKGEKSRRNATLVALESTPPPPAVSSSDLSAPSAQVQFWPTPISKNEKVGDESAQTNNQTDNGLIGLPLMEELLLRALGNPNLMEGHQNNEMNCDEAVVENKNIEEVRKAEEINENATKTEME